MGRWVNWRRGVLGAGLALVLGGGAAAQEVVATHGTSLFGALKYGPDFARFDYVNPDAPKGGSASLSAIGGFDSLNPFILKGRPARGIGLVVETLMEPASDEPSAYYGLIAKTASWPEDFAWVEYELREEARFADGHPVTAEDVVFSFETLTTEGAPHYRAYYANVVKAEAVDDHRVRFTFSETGNRELPQIMGQLSILPAHYWKDREFDATSLEPPLGSGPYRVAEVQANRSIAYERDPNYWGRDLAVNVGRHNFDRVSFEYFRDAEVAFEAFKSGGYDFRIENSSKRWATGYEFPAARDGRVVVTSFEDLNPEPMQGFVFNARRAKFADARVREAFDLAFDFEWMNKNLFYGQYARTTSYFPASELAAPPLPSEAELALLEPFRDQLPEALFTEAYETPATNGSGDNRRNLRAALRLLKAAGWGVADGVLTHGETGEVMEVEFLLVAPTFERVVAPYLDALGKLGIKGTIRVVDTAQYRRRLDGFDFDIVISSFPQSLSPGNEQRDFWSMKAAETEGSRNLMGVKDPVVDALIDKIIYAPDRESLVAATHALDRVLLWGRWLVPQWHTKAIRTAYWAKFGRPDPLPPYNFDFPSVWWSEDGQ